ncbi:solute carrier family 25 member 35-like isoform X2 [Athalia rosae]|uniref:solute carrier family 25 member 35-like isoform X2 n=1 Tax=Athalia rosae TaxID=37344 RepID=UPI0020343400|nr:solute carrier family 25 member 35-like isoform X2 [Athalia rosae]
MTAPSKPTSNKLPGAEFVIGGLAAMGSGCFTNPIDVVKIRLQLQGELEARGSYTKLYKNTMHAAYVVAKHEGIFALQAGFIPAIAFQFVLNGVRLGVFNIAKKHELTLNANGQTSILKTALITGCAGAVGSILGSPLYLVICYNIFFSSYSGYTFSFNMKHMDLQFLQVKTQLQAQAASTIAVGHQHHHSGTWPAFQKLWNEGKFRGLYRGWNAGVPRLFIGSATQLTMFSLMLDWMKYFNVCPENQILATFWASFYGGTCVALTMQPFDVAATRLYNQGVDAKGKGLLYNGVIDALIKIAKVEGIFGLYKGTFPTWLRIAPHTVLCLVFYEEIDGIYSKLTSESQ